MNMFYRNHSSNETNRRTSVQESIWTERERMHTLCILKSILKIIFVDSFIQTFWAGKIF